MKKYLIFAITQIPFIFLIYVIYNQDKDISSLKNQIVVQHNTDKLIDSLKYELFYQQTIIDRYELTVNNLKVLNPKAAKAFESYLYNETK